MIIVAISGSNMTSEKRRFENVPVSIGREPDNDLVLPAHSCSRYHAEIVEERGQYKIVDLGSTNGLEFQSLKVPEVALSTGAEVKVGEYTLSFTIPRVEAPQTALVDGDSMSEPIAQARAGVERPKLIYLNMHVKGGMRTFKIASGVDYTIGRSAGADIPTNDTNCSGRHAMVTSREDEFLIRDLESSNGTAVNGVRVEESRIAAGDVISVGRTTIDVADQPHETRDDDALMARTRIGVALPPIQPPPKEPLEASDPASVTAAVEPESRPATTGPAAVKREHLVALVVAALAIVAAAVLFMQIRGSSTEEEQQLTATESAATAAEAIVQVAPVQRKPLELRVSAAGSVEPQQRITVSAEIAARVLSLPAKEGGRVSRGDLLVKLDDRQIRLQIEEAASSVSKDQVNLAKDDLERKERLFEQGALTRSAHDQAKNRYLTLDSSYSAAQARIAQLREQLAKTRVTAPISGVVARTNISSGEYAAPGTPLVVVENAEEVLVTVEVPDREIVKVKPKQVVEAVSDAFPDREFRGVVEKVGTTANPVSKGFEVEARVANSDGQLRSGMIVTLQIFIDQRDCLVVPQEALTNESADAADVLVVKDGVAHRVQARLGARIDRDVEVLSGLSEGDEVVVFGHEQVRDGEPVKTYSETQ